MVFCPTRPSNFKKRAHSPAPRTPATRLSLRRCSRSWVAVVTLCRVTSVWKKWRITPHIIKNTFENLTFIVIITMIANQILACEDTKATNIYSN